MREDKKTGDGAKKEHSIKVPQLYKEASKILKKFENREGSLNSLVYAGRYRNYQVMYGLLSKLVDNLATVRTAIAVSNLLVEEPKFDPLLAQVFTAQLLYKDSINGNAKPIVVFKKYEEKIKAAAKGKFSAKIKKKDNSARYALVNTLLFTVNDAHTYLENEGYILEEYDEKIESYDNFLERIQNLVPHRYLVDYHIPHLLVFHPKTRFWNSVSFKENVIIPQDKGSCLPVFLSSVGENCKVIDACAAPGNKTLNMVSKMNNKGSVIAIEKAKDRFLTMKNLVSSRGAKCVKAMNKNFTNVNPADYSDVEYIFLDPSCSSSGANLHNDEVSRDRIAKLAWMQGALLTHALSFPSVKEVVYSTCSIHEEENEMVVDEVLKKFCEDFELANLGSKLRGWKHFGKPAYSFGHNCLRTNSAVDHCTGFFVAIFLRKDKDKETECNEKKRKAVKDVTVSQENINSEIQEVGEESTDPKALALEPPPAKSRKKNKDSTSKAYKEKF